MGLFSPAGAARPRRKLAGVLAGSVLALLSAPPPAPAVMIVRNFIPAGNVIPGGLGTAENAPASAVGGGNLVEIFNRAADLWEAAIRDDWTVTLNFAWAPITSLGVHNLLTQVPVAGVPTRETVGTIRFDSDGTSVFFLDPTPLDNSEYATFTMSSANLGGGTLNTGRVYTGATGLAAGRTDLFSVALHEIGHSLGLSSGLTSFINENGDLDIDVVGLQPLPGTVIPTVSGAHLNLATALMFPTIGTGIRRDIAGVDVLANAEVSEWLDVNLDPRQAILPAVPAPAALPLLLVGAGTVGLGRVLRRKTAA